MIFTIRVSVGDYHGFGQRFGPHAFDRQVGRTVSLMMGDRRTWAVVIAANVADGGDYVDLTLDAPDLALAIAVQIEMDQEPPR